MTGRSAQRAPRRCVAPFCSGSWMFDSRARSIAAAYDARMGALAQPYDSTSDWPSVDPTAVHEVTEVHDRPLSSSTFVPGLGVAATFQAPPPHDSASVCVSDDPTA